MGQPHLLALSDSRYAPLWLDQGERPLPLAPLSGEEQCQLLIVGGGFTGLWGALQAKERRPYLDVNLLIANGSNVNATDGDGDTPLRYAPALGDEDKGHGSSAHLTHLMTDTLDDFTSQ